MFPSTPGLHILAATQTCDASNAATELLARSATPYELVKLETPSGGTSKSHYGWLIWLAPTADALVLIVPTQLHRQEDEYATHQLLQAGHRELDHVTLLPHDIRMLTRALTTDQPDHPHVMGDIPPFVQRWVEQFHVRQPKETRDARNPN